MRVRSGKGLSAAITILLFVFLAGAVPLAHATPLTLRVADETHVLKAGDVEEAKVANRHGRYVVELSLSSGAKDLLCRLTTKYRTKKMKILLGSKVVTNAVIMAAICGGWIVISGSFSKAEAEAIVQDLTQKP